MKGVGYDSWYAQVNLQELEKCHSSRFGCEEFFLSPFFLDYEQFQPFEVDVNHKP